MKAEMLLQRLLAVGKRLPADDSVPYAFERRIMARLRASKPLDPLLLWNRILWRFAGPCVALTLLAGAFSWFAQPEQPTTENLVIELETVLYAPLSTTQEVW